MTDPIDAAIEAALRIAENRQQYGGNYDPGPIAAARRWRVWRSQFDPTYWVVRGMPLRLFYFDTWREAYDYAYREAHR